MTDLLDLLDDLEGTPAFIVGEPFTLPGLPEYGEHRVYLCPSCRYTCIDRRAITSHTCKGIPS